MRHGKSGYCDDDDDDDNDRKRKKGWKRSWRNKDDD